MDGDRMQVMLSRKLVFLGGTFVGFFLGWYSFVFIFSPTDADFMRTTTSHYFGETTERDLTSLAKYTDCYLIDPDEDERNHGVKKLGLCGAESLTSNYYYFVALSPTANILYFDFEERKK